MSGAWQIHQQNKMARSTLTDEKKGYNILSKMYKAMDIKDVSQIINDPEEPREQLRADNEKLNQQVLIDQQTIQQQAEQIRQLSALSEVEVIKATQKGESDDKKALLGVAQLQEKAREFDIKTAQDGSQHNDDLAFNIVELETKENIDVTP